MGGRMGGCGWVGEGEADEADGVAGGVEVGEEADGGFDDACAGPGGGVGGFAAGVLGEVAVFDFQGEGVAGE